MGYFFIKAILNTEIDFYMKPKKSVDVELYLHVPSFSGRSSYDGCMGTQRSWLQSQLPCCKLLPFLCKLKLTLSNQRRTIPIIYRICYFYLTLPVQDIESTPGPWYSTMAPVPPFTVRMPATFKMTSLGDVQPDKEPVSFTPITFEEGEKENYNYHQKREFVRKHLT